MCLYFSEWSDQDTLLVLSSQVKARLLCEIFNVLAHRLLYRFYNIDLNQFIDFTQLASRLHLSSFPHPGRSVYHVIDSDFNTNVYFNTLHSTYINLPGPGPIAGRNVRDCISPRLKTRSCPFALLRLSSKNKLIHSNPGPSLSSKRSSVQSHILRRKEILFKICFNPSWSS